MTYSKKRSSRAQKIEQAQKEAEVLDSQVRTDGVGEDPVVRDLLSDKFVEGTNREALDIALALQQLIRGQNAILSRVEGQGEAITRLSERMDKMDKDAQRWNEDRGQFLEEVQTRAEALRIKDPDKKAKLVAKAGAQIQQEIMAARAVIASDDVAFAAWLAEQPIVTVTSMGRIVTVNEAGVIQQVAEPEVIKIRNKHWVLPPGVPVDVPKPVADEFYARQKIKQETVERKKILNANAPLDNTVMAQKWNDINRKYGAQTETMQSDDRS